MKQNRTFGRALFNSFACLLLCITVFMALIDTEGKGASVGFSALDLTSHVTFIDRYIDPSSPEDDDPDTPTLLLTYAVLITIPDDFTDSLSDLVASVGAIPHVNSDYLFVCHRARTDVVHGLSVQSLSISAEPDSAKFYSECISRALEVATDATFVLLIDSTKPLQSEVSFWLDSAAPILGVDDWAALALLGDAGNGITASDEAFSTNHASNSLFFPVSYFQSTLQYVLVSCTGGQLFTDILEDAAIDFITPTVNFQSSVRISSYPTSYNFTFASADRLAARMSALVGDMAVITSVDEFLKFPSTISVIPVDTVLSLERTFEEAAGIFLSDAHTQLFQVGKSRFLLITSQSPLYSNIDHSELFSLDSVEPLSFLSRIAASAEIPLTLYPIIAEERQSCTDVCSKFNIIDSLPRSKQYAVGGTLRDRNSREVLGICDPEGFPIFNGCDYLKRTTQSQSSSRLTCSLSAQNSAPRFSNEECHVARLDLPHCDAVSQSSRRVCPCRVTQSFRNPRHVLYRYFDGRNIGDLILLGFFKRFYNLDLKNDFGFDYCRDCLGSKTHFDQRYDLLVEGGGSLLESDWLGPIHGSQLPKEFVYAFASGWDDRGSLERPDGKHSIVTQHYDDFYHKYSSLTKETSFMRTLDKMYAYFPKMWFGGVRGPISKHVLNLHSTFEAPIIGDSGLLAGLLLFDSSLSCPAADWEIPTSSNGYVAVNWGQKQDGLHFDFDKATKITTQLVIELLENEYSVVFFDMIANDHVGTKLITDAVKTHFGQSSTLHRLLDLTDRFIDNAEHAEFLHFLNCAEFVLSFKLHGTILAHSVLTPALGWSYRIKVWDHMSYMGLTNYALTKEDTLSSAKQKLRLLMDSDNRNHQQSVLSARIYQTFDLHYCAIMKLGDFLVLAEKPTKCQQVKWLGDLSEYHTKFPDVIKKMGGHCISEDYCDDGIP